MFSMDIVKIYEKRNNNNNTTRQDFCFAPRQGFTNYVNIQL